MFTWADSIVWVLMIVTVGGMTFRMMTTVDDFPAGIIALGGVLILGSIVQGVHDQIYEESD